MENVKVCDGIKGTQCLANLLKIHNLQRDSDRNKRYIFVSPFEMLE